MDIVIHIIAFGLAFGLLGAPWLIDSRLRRDFEWYIPILTTVSAFIVIEIILWVIWLLFS
jgi:hypothetical protein